MPAHDGLVACRASVVFPEQSILSILVRSEFLLIVPLQLPRLLPRSTSMRLLITWPFWKRSASTVEVHASTFVLCILLQAEHSQSCHPTPHLTPWGQTRYFRSTFVLQTTDRRNTAHANNASWLATLCNRGYFCAGYHVRRSWTVTDFRTQCGYSTHLQV